MKYNEIKFAIVGGGTAGWITALKLRKQFPQNSITVIESSEIGILGAGEGTTPQFVDFLKDVDINILEFINETKATVKTGIKFTNWHGDGSFYFHPFNEEASSFESHSRFFGMKLMSEEKSLNQLSVSALCSEQDKLPVRHENGQTIYETKIALHFDARLTAEYLKSVAVTRNVNLFDSKVNNTLLDQNNNITTIILENNQHVDCDFVFDCTGFKRMFVGELYKTKWLDYQDSLPVDRALPFFIENNTNKIQPYTEAIAMKYGWVWKIPVQGRYGCGYVFDSSYASDEEIANEIKEMFGDVNIPRFFSFKAGYYEDVWVNNCIAVGLSSGFIEPLEATSIWVSLNSINFLFDVCLPGMLNSNRDVYKKLYNNYVRDTNSEIKDFIQLHYLTKRNDSKFWQEYTTKNIIAERLLKYKKIDSIYEYFQNNADNFSLFNQFFVFSGVKFYNTNVFKKHVDSFLEIPRNANTDEKIEEYKKQISTYANNYSVDHFAFLEQIKSNKNDTRRILEMD